MVSLTGETTWLGVAAGTTWPGVTAGEETSDGETVGEMPGEETSLLTISHGEEMSGEETVSEVTLSELTGTEMELSTGETAGEDSTEPGPLELGIQLGTALDGDQMESPLEKSEPGTAGEEISAGEVMPGLLMTLPGEMDGEEISDGEMAGEVTPGEVTLSLTILLGEETGA